jgi:hypothetical protein
MAAKLRSLAYLTALLIMMPIMSHAQAARVQLAWEPPLTALDGTPLGSPVVYKLYYGLYQEQTQTERGGTTIDVGNQFSYIVTGLNHGDTYYFAITAYDDLGNESDFSDMVVHAIANAAALDDLSALNQEGEIAAEHEEMNPGDGEESLQLVEDHSFVSSYWTNYRVNLSLGSARYDDIGVMFRFQDSDNYYRFSWSDQHRQRRLVKYQNGTFTLLAADTTLDVTEPSYQLTIVADDANVEVWIDATPIFSITDDSFPYGTIALYVSGPGENYFHHIVVEDLDTDAVLLQETFPEGMLADWMIVDEGVAEVSSEWSVEAGILVQRASASTELT